MDSFAWGQRARTFGDRGVLIIDCDANVDAVTNDGKSALVFARLHNRDDVVKFLSNANRKTANSSPKLSPVAKSSIVSSAKGLAAIAAKFGFQKNTRPNPRLEEQFREASRNGNLDKVKKCMMQNVDVNAQDSNGWTALHFACQNGRTDIVGYLVREGKVDVSLNDMDGWTALHKASKEGHLELVHFLVRNGKADVEGQSTGGWRALHCSSDNGFFEVTQFLVRDCMANVEVKTTNGVTPLHLASGRGHLKLVRFLVKDGKADVNAREKNGWTALHFATAFGYLEVIKYLIQDCKMDIEVKEEDGWTSLHLASANGHLEVVRFLLIESNATIDTLTKDGKSAMDLATTEQKDDVVTFLSYFFENSSPVADLSIKGSSKEIAAIAMNAPPYPDLDERFREAAKVGNLDEVKECLQQNVNVNDQDINGWTALRLASQYGHLEVVRCLVIDGKANVEMKENNGQTALHRASWNGHLDVVQFLVRDCKATMDCRSNAGWTALHLACENGHLEVVQYLVRNSNDDMDVKENKGFTSLHLACRYGHLEVVRYLVRDGRADVGAKTNNGVTTLHLACQNGHLEVVQYLVQVAEADVETRTNLGRTALHEASEFGHLEVARFLLMECNANIDAMTDYGTTSLDLAMKAEKDDIVKFLSERRRNHFGAGTIDPNSSGFLEFPGKLTSTADTVVNSLAISTVPQPSVETGPNCPVSYIFPSLELSSNAISSSSHESTALQTLAVTETNDVDTMSKHDDETIFANRKELERMLFDPIAEPTRWNIKYIEDCTCNFTSKVLGEGAFGKVFVGCDNVLGTKFAVKRVPLTVSDLEALNDIILSFRLEVLVCYRRVSVCKTICVGFQPFFLLSRHVYTGTKAVPTSQHCGVVRV
jgi:ankyrin repeat protein